MYPNNQKSFKKRLLVVGYAKIEYFYYINQIFLDFSYQDLIFNSIMHTLFSTTNKMICVKL